MNVPTFLYVADPMCSWCWGFSPVIDKLRRLFQDRANIQLLLGGLRPGNTERFDESRRDFILQHWHAVHQRTDQPFNFNFQMGPTFTYDTEPASRATMIIRERLPGMEWEFLRSIQEDFYVRNTDVTQVATLEKLAIRVGMDRSLFLQAFHDQRMKEMVWTDFDQARQLGVEGFPTLLGKNEQSVSILIHGYQDFETVIPIFDKFLGTIT